MRVCNIQTFARLPEEPSLTLAQASCPDLQHVQIVEGDDDSPSSFKLNKIQVGGSMDDLVDSSVIPRLLKQLFAGYNVLIVNGGASSEAIKTNEVLTRILDYVDSLAGKEQKTDLKVSFGAWALSDVSCVDLVNLDRWTGAQIGQLMEQVREDAPTLANTPLHHINEPYEFAISEAVLDAIQGYQMPLVMLLRVQTPTSLAHLLFIDLLDTPLQSGAIQTASTSQFRHSIGALKTLVWAMDECQTGERELDPSKDSFLTSFLAPFLGGDALGTAVFDLSKLTFNASLAHSLNMLSSMGRVKNRATAHRPNLLFQELDQLASINKQIEADRQAGQARLALIQRACAKLATDRTHLKTTISNAQSSSQIQRLELELEQARAAMEHLEMQDRLREAEIYLVNLDQKNAQLMLGLEKSQTRAEALEASMGQLKEQERQRETQVSNELNSLQAALAAKQLELTSAQERAEELARNSLAATQHQNQLQNALAHAEQARASLTDQLNALQSQNNSFQTRVQTELATQTQGLAIKQAAQERLVSELRLTLEQSKRDEEQLRAQNNALQARLTECAKSMADLAQQVQLLQAQKQNSSMHFQPTIQQPMVTPSFYPDVMMNEFRKREAQLQAQIEEQRVQMEKEIKELKRHQAQKDVKLKEAPKPDTRTLIEPKIAIAATEETIVNEPAKKPRGRPSKEQQVGKEEITQAPPQLVKVPVIEKEPRQQSKFRSKAADLFKKNEHEVTLPSAPPVHYVKQNVHTQRIVGQTPAPVPQQPTQESRIVSPIKKTITQMAASLAKLATPAPPHQVSLDKREANEYVAPVRKSPRLTKAVDKVVPKANSTTESKPRKQSKSDVENVPPALAKKLTSNNNTLLADQKQTPAAMTSKIVAKTFASSNAATSLAPGISFLDNVPRKKVKIGALGGGNDQQGPTSIPPLVTRTKTILNQPILTSNEAVPQEIKAAFNVKLPPKTKK